MTAVMPLTPVDMARMIETLKRLCDEAHELQERLSTAMAESARNDRPAASADPRRGDSRRVLFPTGAKLPE